MKRYPVDPDGKFTFNFNIVTTPPARVKQIMEERGYDYEQLRADLVVSTTNFNGKLNFNILVDYLNLALGKADQKEHAQKLWDKYIENCHPFFFLGGEMSTASMMFNDKGQYAFEHTDLDLPYENCHFEIKGSHLMQFLGPEDEDEEYDYFFISSLSVKEIEPKQYHFFAHTTVRFKGDVTMKSSSLEITPLQKETWMVYNALIAKLLFRLKKDEVGVETSSGQKIKIGTGKDKRFWKPKPTVHISPKKYINEAKPVLGAEIDWSHRWPVRGHWREVKGIGKDREGNYTKAGMTWVVAHERGPEDKPLIKKTYVVE